MKERERERELVHVSKNRAPPAALFESNNSIAHLVSLSLLLMLVLVASLYLYKKMVLFF